MPHDSVHFPLSSVLKTAPLPRVGGHCKLAFLSVAHIDHILALQAAVLNDLTEPEKVFLLEKNRTFFERHFQEENAMIGVVHQGRLIAQCVILNPTAAHPATGMVDMCLNAQPEEVTILQGVIVDAAYRGNRLMTEMVDCWLDAAQKQGRLHVIAEVATGNVYSWQIFLKEGLDIHSIGIDPADGARVYNMHAGISDIQAGRLKGEFNQRSRKDAVACNKDDIALQRKLLEMGYRGVDFDSGMNILYFKPSSPGVKVQLAPKLP